MLVTFARLCRLYICASLNSLLFYLSELCDKYLVNMVDPIIIACLFQQQHINDADTQSIYICTDRSDNISAASNHMCTVKDAGGQS